MACTDSLKPFFDWIKQSTVTQTGTKKFPVHITLTIHSSTFVVKKPSDHKAETSATHVEYAHGEVEFASEGHLHGHLLGHVNAPTPKPDEPAFTSAKALTFKIKVFPDGSVSILRLTHGKPLLGQGPVEFKGTCTKGGLITGVSGERSYTLSFLKGKKTTSV